MMKGKYKSMNKNDTLQSILSHLAQNAALPSEINLWPTIQARLSARKTFMQAKESEMKASTSNSKRFRAAFIGALTLLLALGMIFVLPQGRAWAANILRFFTPSESNTFSLPTQNTTPTKVTANPTFNKPALTGCEDGAASLSYRCAVGTAEAALGFNVRELPSIPEEFAFAGVVANPNQHSIQIMYARDGGELSITQVNGASMASVWETTWGAVPLDSVEKVQINGVDGEYVRGMFVEKSQTGTKAEWEPDAPVQRLRWQEGNMFFEIQLAGLPGNDDLIGKDWLISLAESLN
jgi:hypothetical protein